MVIGGYRLASESREAAFLEKENAVLRGRIEEVSLSDTTKTIRTPVFSGKNGKPVKSDWERLAGSWDRGFGRLNWLRIKEQVKNLSEEELLAALEEIRGLSMSSNIESSLSSILLYRLAETNPEAAVSWLISYEGKETYSESGAFFRKWVNKDPAKALAWYDQKISEGIFDAKSLDGRDPLRSRFEKEAIELLLKRDPAEVPARLKNLPKEMMEEVMGGVGLSKVDESARRLFMQSLRENLTERERDYALMAIISNVSPRDQECYAGVSEFLNQVQASPSERKAAVLGMGSGNIMMGIRVGGKTSGEALSEFRQWARAQAPEVVDEATGRSISILWATGSMEGREAMAYLESCIQEGSDPATLIRETMRGGLPGGAREALRAVAAKIPDETKRREILNQLK
ncbi:MAG: hypothetical protein QM680_03295 [Luteolibacter sp.]